MKIIFGLLFSTAMAYATTAGAVTVFECVDKDGHTTYNQLSCPSDSVKKSEKQVAGREPGAPPDMAEIAKENPVVLYSIKKCDSCDLVRLLLQKRGIPFTEKDAGANLDVQTELKKATGGELSVPTVSVGGQVVTGYNKSALEGSLDKVGYPPSAETAAAAATPGNNPGAAPEQQQATPGAAAKPSDEAASTTNAYGNTAP